MAVLSFERAHRSADGNLSPRQRNGRLGMTLPKPSHVVRRRFESGQAIYDGAKEVSSRVEQNSSKLALGADCSMQKVAYQSYPV